jgi:L-2-hydroxyglutarate oxidase LhgO
VISSANIVVVGGGVVGLAIAQELSRLHDDVFLLEGAAAARAWKFDAQQRGDPAAGIYYRPGSLKAFHCVEGSRLLYEFCGMHGVHHARVGKLIVAQHGSEIPELETAETAGR